MSVKEIENAIALLPAKDLDELSDWLTKYQSSARRHTLLDLAGSITPEDARIMSEASEDCRKIDMENW